MSQVIHFDASQASSKLTDAIARYVAATGVEVSQAVREHARLLLRDLIAFTPPNGSKEQEVTARRQGMFAVARDIARAVRPLREEEFDNPRIKQMIRQRDYAKLQEFVNHIRSGVLAGLRVVPFAPQLHQTARDKRGRVTRKKTRFATPDTDLMDQYTKKIQERIGMAKGGWAAAFLHLGGKPARWFARHMSQGTFIDETKGLTPFIDLINSSPWARSTGDEDRQLTRAIEARVISIQKRMDLAAEKAARKAGVL